VSKKKDGKRKGKGKRYKGKRRERNWGRRTGIVHPLFSA